MDPTQDLAETRKLMAAVKQAVEKIIDDFRRKRQDTPPADPSVQGRT